MKSVARSESHDIWVQTQYVSQFSDELASETWGSAHHGLNDSVDALLLNMSNRDRCKRALHWTSATEKWFVLDLDIKDFGASYQTCASTHLPKSSLLCSTCWREMWYTAIILELALQKVFACTPLVTTHTWKPMLYCLSGNSGLHLYAHPRTGMHTLNERQRRDIIHAIHSTESTLNRLLPPGYADALPKDSFVRQAPYLPIDIAASAICEGKKIRLPFSPNLKGMYCCTPVAHAIPLPHELTTVQPATMENSAVTWAQQFCKDTSNIARLTTAINVFTSWMHGS